MTPDGPTHLIDCLILGTLLTAAAILSLWPLNGPWSLAWGWGIGCGATLALLVATSRGQP